MLTNISNEARAGQLLCRVRRSHVETVTVGVVPRLARTRRATDDRYRLLLMGNEGDMNGTPDFSAEGIDDHLLQG